MKNQRGVYKDTGIFFQIMVLVGFALFFTLLMLPPVGFLGFLKLPESWFMRFSQLFMSVGMFVVPPFALAFLVSENTRSYLHLNTKTDWKMAVSVFVFMLLIIPFINLLGDLNHRIVLPHAFSFIENQLKSMEDQANLITERLLNTHSFNTLLVNILVIAIVPALGEELFFRGALQSVFQGQNRKIAGIWWAAIIFSAIHMQFYGFIPRMLMGAFFGYLVFWSGNLWLAILAHFTNNVVAIIFYYLKYNGIQTFDIDNIGTGNTLWIGILSGVAGGICIYFFYRALHPKKKITD
jgi:hypothetical protein